MIGQLLDTILDRTILPGYTRVGYRMRRGTWSHAELQPMDGKVVLVTGGTSGSASPPPKASRASAPLSGWRSAASSAASSARAQIMAQSSNSDVQVGLCDLSDLESVRQFAKRLGGETWGAWTCSSTTPVRLARERTLSVDGIELTFATNVLGPFLLTNLLLPLLEKSKPARIINVSSGGMYTQRIYLDDLQMTHEKFDGPIAYARTKRAQVILSELWAERLRDTGIVVHAMHPGWADTPGLEVLAATLLRPDKAAAAHTPRRRRHDRLARRCRPTGAQLRRLLARPPRAPDPPRAVDQADTPGPRAAMDRMRTPQRLAPNTNPRRLRPIRENQWLTTTQASIRRVRPMRCSPT